MKNKKVIGIVISVLCVVLAGAAYVFRPPSDFSEAFMMASQGRQIYLQPPIYTAALVISGLMVIGGVGLVNRVKNS